MVKLFTFSLTLFSLLFLSCNASLPVTLVKQRGSTCALTECAPNRPICLNLGMGCDQPPCSVRPACYSVNRKPGKCGSSAQGGIKYSSTCESSCKKDGDCIGAHKCCKLGCAHHCSLPAPKPSRCPNRKSLPTADCVIQCGSDADCAGRKKCCRTKCGRVCARARTEDRVSGGMQIGNDAPRTTPLSRCSLSECSFGYGCDKHPLQTGTQSGKSLPNLCGAGKICCIGECGKAICGTPEPMGPDK